MKNYSVIIWDFNGTIIDDVRGALAAVNDMLLRRNQNPIDLSDYRDAVDSPIWKFYEKVFEEGSITPAEAIREFNSGYDIHKDCTWLMNGSEQVLTAFRNRGKKQIIVSASHIENVKTQLAELGVEEYFDAVLALSDFTAGDKTFLAREYLESNSISSADAVVIGDSVADFIMAQALGCDCILNTQGHQSREAIVKTGVPVIESLAELISIIE